MTLVRSYKEDIASYPKMPLQVGRNGGTWPTPKYQFSLIACARWETQYIQEWILYHRAIGFDHIYLYCNDDDPVPFYRAVSPFTEGDRPFVTYLHFSFQGLQFQMYMHALRTFSHETAWLMFLDIDEFLCIKGLNQIAPFVSRFTDDVDAIYFNWCSFGNNGYAVRPAGDVLINYTRREAAATPFTKVLIRAQSVPYAQFFEWNVAPVMHDYTLLNPNLNVVNVLGEDLNFYYKDFPKLAWDFLDKDERARRLLDVGFVAHFNCKSDEDFRLRVERGLKGDYKAEAMWGQKTAQQIRDHHARTNAVHDDYLRRFWLDQLTRGRKLAVFPPETWTLLSEGRKATQSSTIHNRPLEEDAQAAVSGLLTGRPQNHTGLDTDPWWAVDLGDNYRVHEVRLFNRLDGVLDRMATFQIQSSIEKEPWTLRHAKLDAEIFGGVDGAPYVWCDREGFVARYIRLLLPGENRYLHLDQIQVFGEGPV